MICEISLDITIIQLCYAILILGIISFGTLIYNGWRERKARKRLYGPGWIEKLSKEFYSDEALKKLYEDSVLDGRDAIQEVFGRPMKVLSYEIPKGQYEDIRLWNGLFKNSVHDMAYGHVETFEKAREQAKYTFHQLKVLRKQYRIKPSPPPLK